MEREKWRELTSGGQKSLCLRPFTENEKREAWKGERHGFHLAKFLLHGGADERSYKQDFMVPPLSWQSKNEGMAF